MACEYAVFCSLMFSGFDLYGPFSLTNIVHPHRHAVLSQMRHLMLYFYLMMEEKILMSQRSWISWLYLPGLDSQVSLIGLVTKLLTLFFFFWKF